MELSLENVSKNYFNNNILSNISIDFEKGKFTSILGRNGCGKSTIVKLISRQVSANGGKVMYLDTNIEYYLKKDIAKKIAFLSQFNESSQDITVYDYLLFGRLPYNGIFKKPSINDLEIIEKIVIQTNLTNYKNRLISTLSGGEKQRVYLALCLIQEPEIIILDEPTNHLDIKYQYQLLDLIRNINQIQNVTVICVIHDINQAIKYSDEIIFIKDGQVHTKGNVSEIITYENIKSVFEIESKIYDIDGNFHVDFVV